MLELQVGKVYRDLEGNTVLIKPNPIKDPHESSKFFGVFAHDDDQEFYYSKEGIVNIEDIWPEGNLVEEVQ